MIVIISEVHQTHFLPKGSTFNLMVKHEDYYLNVIEEEIKKDCIINYACAFVFCAKDGSCKSIHMAGFFGNEDNLPDEILNAKKINDLTVDQLQKFIATCPSVLTF